VVRTLVDLRSSFPPPPPFRSRFYLTEVGSDYDFGLRARFRLRIRAHRFISAERSSGVSFASEALPAALRIRLLSFFLTPSSVHDPPRFSLTRESVSGNCSK
jgi:hypothetical protein